MFPLYHTHERDHLRLRAFFMVRVPLSSQTRPRPPHRHTKYIHSYTAIPGMDTGGCSPAPPRVEGGSLFSAVRQSRRARGSSRMIEASKLATGEGGARISTLAQARPRKKTKPGDPAGVRVEPMVSIPSHKLLGIWKPHTHYSGAKRNMLVIYPSDGQNNARGACLCLVQCIPVFDPNGIGIPVSGSQ